MKKIFAGIFILFVFQSFTIENGNPPGELGTLTGNITFKSAIGSISKPDAGSTIYAINEEDAKSMEFGAITMVVDNFQINKSEYTISINNTIDPVKVKQAQDYFTSASINTSQYLQGFKKIPGIVKSKIDAYGKYSMNLKPGRYYLLIVSAKVVSDNKAELKGNIDYEIADIKSGRITHMDYTFEQQELLWIKQITRKKIYGC